MCTTCPDELGLFTGYMWFSEQTPKVFMNIIKNTDICKAVEVYFLEVGTEFLNITDALRHLQRQCRTRKVPSTFTDIVSFSGWTLHLLHS
jgi:hypothetical protein